MNILNEKNGLVVDNEIIKKANLSEEIMLSATDHLIILKKSKMNAMEVIKTIEALKLMENDLLSVLVDACGECDDDCCHVDIDTEDIRLPDYLLEIAGIPEDAKLTPYVEEDSGIVRIEEAEYDYDLADVSEDMRYFLSVCGICLGELDALLVGGDVIYG